MRYSFNITVSNHIPSFQRHFLLVLGGGDPVQEESSSSPLQEEGAACLKGGDTGKVPGRERG